MILLNFAHPITDSQLAQLGSLAGLDASDPVEVVTVPTQFDPAAPFGPQAAALATGAMAALAASGAGRPGGEPQDRPSPETRLQSEAILVNLPAHNVIAALLLAELHGRMGHFPAILRLRPVTGVASTTYEVAEILNLQAARDAARHQR
jgi:hypothetical protein